MKNFANTINTIQNKTGVLNSIYKPLFFRVYNASEYEELNKLLLLPGIIIVDPIKGQLKELIKYKNPNKKYTDDELDNESIIHIGKLSIYEYGVWVYYPWTNRLVHILDEEEFVDVRTSRNQNKITKEERNLLSKKIIGIIGLSVGQSVSVTIAMERICNEIRLADFDLLELTNLNRIRTGVHNLGLAKVYSVAREISEIDPFIKVVCFPEGLSESNMDDFFIKNGKLDLLIEESDGFDIKILSRYKARELKIPVLMEASDRCTVDVERFDLEPNRSILHGIVDHLDIETLKTLKTTEEKIPYMLDVLGIETSSLRLKASMLEIEQSINTWPQLASAVTMGGGIATDVSRRLLLNQFTDSGRYHLDIDQLIGNKTEVEAEGKKQLEVIDAKKTLTQIEMHEIALNLCKSLNENQYSPSKSEIQKIIEAAVKAPSQGNRQPWTWYYLNGNLFLFHDTSRSNSLLNFDNIDSYICFGAATENLILKSHEIGLNPDILLFPKNMDNRVVCQFTFSKKEVTAISKEFDYLVTEIDTRLTNRTISERQIIKPDLIIKLQHIASSIKGVQMNTIDNINHIESISDIIGRVERLKMMNRRGHTDFVNEMRWSDKETLEKRDGIDLNLLDINATARAGLIVAKNWEVVKMLKEWKKGSAFEIIPKKLVSNSSAIGFVTVNECSPQCYFNAGRSIQRVWLAANKMNISIQPLSAATSLFLRLTKADGIDLDNEFKEELSYLRDEFEKVIISDAQNHGIFLFRLCIGNLPKTMSLRRNIDDVLIYG